MELVTHLRSGKATIEALYASTLHLYRTRCTAQHQNIGYRCATVLCVM